MTPQEFKAWFDGFTEAFTGVPTKAQWARVKERVGEIDGKPVTERIYVDRYLPAYPRQYWHTYTGYGVCGAVGTNTIVTNANASTANLATAGAQYQNAVNRASPFNSGQAMLDLGRAEYQALS